MDRVVVHVAAESNQVQAEIHWHGGFLSRVQFCRSVPRYQQLPNYDEFWERVLQLRQAGHSSARIAAKLNADGFVTPRRYTKFSKEQIFQLLMRKGLARTRDQITLGTHEWRLPELARHLGVTTLTLRSWAKHLWVHGRQTPTQRYWILWADDEEIDRLKRMASLSRPGFLRYPSSLTTAKPRPDN